MYECIVPYMCERDGGQEVCMADRSRAPFAFPSPIPLDLSLSPPFLSSFFVYCSLLADISYLCCPLALTWVNVNLLTASCAG